MGTKRRWLDWDILAKMGGGLALCGLSFALLLATDRIWIWGWVMGGILFLWGLFSIGDLKNDWE
jgi:hypothetical protein